MKKLFTALVILCLGVLLCACSSQKEREAVQETAAFQAPLGMDVFEQSTAQGGLSAVLKQVCAPYEDILLSVAQSGCLSADYVIPGQKLAEAGDYAARDGARPQDGRYRFFVNISGEHSYSLWGQDVLNDLSTPEPEATGADHMELVFGDTVVSGGGLINHRFDYDIREDGSAGAIEDHTTEDGVTSGHERFDWQIRDGKLYFSDAVLDAYNAVDGNYPYIIVFGVISRDSLCIVQFTVNKASIGVPAEYLMPSSLNEDTLLYLREYDSTLYTQNGTLTEYTFGIQQSYSLNKRDK